MGLILGLPLWNSQFFGVPPSFQTCPGFFCYAFGFVWKYTWNPETTDGFASYSADFSLVLGCLRGSCIFLMFWSQKHLDLHRIPHDLIWELYYIILYTYTYIYIIFPYIPNGLLYKSHNFPSFPRLSLQLVNLGDEFLDGLPRHLWRKDPNLVV